MSSQRDRSSARASKRVTLERWSPKSLAASATVLEPSRTVRMISCCLVSAHLGWPTHLDAAIAGGDWASSGPFTNHRALEFSKTSQHLHHHAARRGCRIHRLSEAPKASACLAVRYVLVRMIVGSQIVHGRYNGSAQETEIYVRQELTRLRATRLWGPSCFVQC